MKFYIIGPRRRFGQKTQFWLKIWKKVKNEKN
jgi:hypothetical protein